MIDKQLIFLLNKIKTKYPQSCIKEHQQFDYVYTNTIEVETQTRINAIVRINYIKKNKFIIKWDGYNPKGFTTIKELLKDLGIKE